MKLTKKTLKRLINEVLEEEIYDTLSEQEEEFSEQLGSLLSGDASSVVQGIILADSLDLPKENVPFHLMDFHNKEHDFGPEEMLEIADTIEGSSYWEQIDPLMRKFLKKAMEQGIRRRLEKNLMTGIGAGVSRVKAIIRNELRTDNKIQTWKP